MDTYQGKSIVFFDGICLLCDKFIHTLIRKDKDEKLLFSALQSEQSTILLKPFGLKPKNLESMVLLHENKVYTKSKAVIKIIELLPFNWLSILLIGKLLPPFFNNAIYNLVAKVRYKVIGKSEECLIPEQKIRNRFIL